MSLLDGLAVLQLGDGLAAAVCGRCFADAGASVVTVGARTSDAFSQYLNHSKTAHDILDEIVSSAALIIAEGSPRELRGRGHDLARLRQLNSSATIALVSPFGQTGPLANRPATDLTLACASGIARLLTGQVDDLSEPPVRPTGQQSAMIGGLAAACAAMASIATAQCAAMIDVSIQEALATLAVGELAQCGLTGKQWSRRRLKDGNGATVTILPAKDGYVAVSPREEAQWLRWLGVMGDPAWGKEPRFQRKADRIDNWDALHALMSQWSQQHAKQWIADQAQAAHVPCFPLGELAEHLASEQLDHRGFFSSMTIKGREVRIPSAPYRVDVSSVAATAPAEPTLPANTCEPPLRGVRVLDFSWVIAGPTTTRHLAALGAEVIKVEAPGPGDPARQSHLHTVLGQGKKAIVLDLKSAEGKAVAKDLVAQSDIVIENFATGVMARLGLDWPSLKAVNPSLIYVSASGLGRTGPGAKRVAYGTLLQSHAGFAGLNRHPEVAPRVGFAWLDPMCGLMLPFIASAALRRRQETGGNGAYIDFSMLEAMLWSLADPLLAGQLGAPSKPVGNLSSDTVPHGVYRCEGDDQWIGLAVQSDEQWRKLCGVVPGLSAYIEQGFDERYANQAAIEVVLGVWLLRRRPSAAVEELASIGIAAAPVAGASDLLNDRHLQRRGFWHAHGDGVLPGLPWQASFPYEPSPAPDMGEDTDRVLADVLQMPADEILRLRKLGAIQ